MQLIINDVIKDIDVDPNKPLLWVIREDFKLTGTKYGCGRGFCGACTVEVDGAITRSCVLPVSTLKNKRVTTIEHKSDNITRAVQRAWIEEQVPQCGYCQSGQILAASQLLRRNPAPNQQDIASAMTNLCRCGTYPRIKTGIQRATELIKEEKDNV